MSTTPARKRLSDEDIDAIKRANHVLDVIEQHVTLRRSGSTYKGLCPFHDERTPSFHVNPANETWRCYGCQMSGDVIDFIKEVEGGDFRYAASLLAERSGITLKGVDDAEDDERERKLRARLYEANAAASDYFTHLLLNDPDARTAREFLRERKFTSEHATTFQCGYSPRKSPALHTVLTDNGFTIDELISAGLARRAESGRVYDVFQGRLMWTIHSEFDKPIGFGARRLYDDDWNQGKFINTSETPLYKKSEVLYGFDRARRDAVKKRHIYVVEGYADVMAAQVAGALNVVATCGTSFTKEHLRILRRTVGDTGEITFGLDDDAAGRKASMTVYGMASTSVRRLTTLGGDFGGKDPDDVRRHHGDDALLRLLANRKPLLESVLRATIADVDIDTPEDKAYALDQVVPLLADITDTVIVTDYAEKAATLIGVKPADVTARLRQHHQGDTAPAQIAAETDAPSAPRVERVEREILRVYIQNENTARLLDDTTRPLFITPVHRALCDAIRAATRANPERLWFERIKTHLPFAHMSLLLDLATQGSPVNDDAAVEYTLQLVEQLRTEHVHDTASDLANQIGEAQTEDDRIAALSDLIELARATNQ